MPSPDHESPPFLEVDTVSKRFGDLVVLDRVSLSMERGRTLALLGPSGSGKTTLLRILAGFEEPDQGSIRVQGREVDHLSAVRRGFGMVFQHYALFPHLDVGENVAFGLHHRPPEDTGKIVARALRRVDLEGFEDRSVDELSGGQQQRVAVARALAPEPRLLLLDEPLSNLDPSLRERTRRKLQEVIREVGIPTILVTH
ncbi:MAG: ABC transporter ATP-binding protein, partial [Thermoanaerobaculia bacterium]|nr:ABC transporter ATP-binding protein [Thermoanaerobaculia bacterium]